jgi:sugar lactone lactonase YvrE
MPKTRRHTALLAAPLALLAAYGGGPAQAAQAALPDIRIDDTGVFPESITSAADGSIYVGSVKGIVYRAMPGEATAEPWIRPDSVNGILTIFGVLADEASDTLWLCSTPNAFGTERSQGPASLKAFGLGTGSFEASYPLPPPASVCNDIAVAADGSAYISDTRNGRIFKLAKGAGTLALYGADPALVGIEGLAFGADGNLYVNNVRSNKVFRVDTAANGTMTGLTSLSVSRDLAGPDGLRHIAGNRFLQAEDTGRRVEILTIAGNEATLDVLAKQTSPAPGATPVGDTAYVLQTDIRYLIDPALKGKDPGPFVIRAVPLKPRWSHGEAPRR